MKLLLRISYLGTDFCGKNRGAAIKEMEAIDAELFDLTADAVELAVKVTERRFRAVGI